MPCTANTNSISSVIAAGTFSASLIVDPAASNGLTVSAAGVKAPSNVTSSVTTATAAGTSGSFTAGFNGTIGNVLSLPSITNPSVDRTMIGLYVIKAVGENISWLAGSTATVALQVSIDGGSTWSVQSFNSYNNTPAGPLGYGAHVAHGVFGPIAASSSSTSGILQAKIVMACTAGGGNVLNSGDLDMRVLMVNQ